MASQGPLRSASARSTSSFDSLDEFLSEVRCYLLASRYHRTGLVGM